MRLSRFFVRMLVACALGLVFPALVTAQVNIDINIGTPSLPPPPVVLVSPPRLVVIPQTPVFYAPDVPYNYFFYGKKYYVFHEGAWFAARSHQGPWQFIAVEKVPRPLLGVPVAYYKIPPGHLKKGEHPGKGHGKGHKHKKHKEDD